MRVQRLFSRVTVLTSAAAIALLWWHCARGDRATCATAAVDQVRAINVCRDEYARTGDPMVGVIYANELRRGGRLDDARALASQLLASTAYGKAAQVLARVANDAEDLAPSRALLAFARVTHACAGDTSELAIDDQVFGATYLKESRFTDAVLAFDRCLEEAGSSREAQRIAGYCHQSAGDALTRLGHYEAARRELSLARSLATAPRDLANLELKEGEFEEHFDLGPERSTHFRTATVHYERALGHAEQAKATIVAQSVLLNLVYSLAEQRRFDEAERYLAHAKQLDVDGEDAATIAQLTARIAYRRGNLGVARQLATASYDQLEVPDERIRACVMLAEIALASNAYGDAAIWAARGVEIVDAMRDAQIALELRPWLLSVRRRPSELLFIALVRQGSFDDAVVALDRWQGRTLLDAIERRSPPITTTRMFVLRTREMRQLLPVLTRAPIARPIARARLFAGLRDADLIALVVADNSVFRIASRGARRDIVEVGSLAELRLALERFIEQPTRTSPGDQLGASLLGEDAFRDTRDTLYVLLDSELSNLPVAALRAHGRTLTSIRPIVRAVRLSELSCVPPMTSPKHAIVIADANDDLRAARGEADAVARTLHSHALHGTAATSAALFTAGRDDVLHVATHATIEVSIGALALRDRTVPALEIAAASAGPRLVVLAACGAAVSTEGELSASLATGFIASGSAQVIATLRPVSDAAAAEIMNAFYAAGGIADPAGALARVQSALADGSNPDWPSFAVFGHDICRKDPP